MMLVLGLVLVPAAAPARRSRVGACDRHRSQAGIVGRRVLVYRVFTHGRPRDPAAAVHYDHTYYACLRPAGAPMLVGEQLAYYGEYPPNRNTDAIQAAGTDVAARSSSGDGNYALCVKNSYVGSPPCPLPKDWIRFIELRGRRSIDVPTGIVSALALSPRNAVAWTESGSGSGSELRAIVLHPAGHGLTGSTQLIDTGRISDRSLHFTGLTLHWRRNGHSFSRRLR